LAQYWEVSVASLQRFSPQELSNTLYGCGLLAIAPPAAWMLAYWAAVAACLTRCDGQEGQCMIAQNYSNMLYAAALLSLWDFPVLTALWQRLNDALRGTSVAEDRLVGLCQLYHVHLVANVERPGLLAAPSAALLETAQQAWRASPQGNALSALHTSVSACLTTMKVAHSNERWCERSEHNINIALRHGAQRIALQVDGPSRFLRNGQPDGPTRLRNRYLVAHGWRVAVVGCREWDALRTHSQREREEYLVQLLHAATAAPPV
jgi:hypothetical protein